MSAGFGWNFYGFFLFAIVWCVAYFGWALAANRRERRRGTDAPRGHGDG